MKKLLFSFCFIVMALSSGAAALEREREGGMATRQPDGALLLEIEDLEDLAVLPSFDTQPIDRGNVRVSATGVELFPFYQSLFVRYSKLEPNQVLTFPDRQIVYARGVTCIRHFNTRSWELVESGDLEPKEWDQYGCRFVMDLRTGFTKSSPAPEPRPRMGAGN